MSAKESPNPHWFFTSFPAPTEALPLTLHIADADLTHHLKTVMRLKPGEELVLVNKAEQQPYRVVLTEFQGKGLVANLVARLPVPRQSQIRVIAAASLIKGPRWDWMLQKLAELGVDEIIPVQARRSIIEVKQPEAKQERWHQILKNAAEQSEQLRIPTITLPMTLQQLLTKSDEHGECLKLLASERATEPLARWVKPGLPEAEVLFVIGPEGGWTEAEIELLHQGGFHSVSLGDKILRSETAALYLATVIHYVHQYAG